jgi:murein DD-endopeptidase MepM/ murein hydrolase activator NlpD
MAKAVLRILLIILLFIFSTRLVGATTISYLITEGFHADSPDVGGVGRIIFWKPIYIDYKYGNMLISSTPDGTGSAKVSDTLRVLNTPLGDVNPNGFVFDAFPNCLFQKDLPATDVTNLFRPGGNNVLVRLEDWCGSPKEIGPLYLVNTNAEPEGFLDLPWDYEHKGLTFTEAALSINSFFDHEYPLLSSGLNEPAEDSKVVLGYDGKIIQGRQYTTHDGYDYATLARVNLGDPVLAAASGWATYDNSCAPCGNMIKIDHQNSYQTRYLHLQKDGLISQTPGEKVWVEARQPIGKVGATGNVSPPGNLGAHIHFGVFKDKNGDGDFEDNVPDGVTDPFGWQGKEPDPWSTYTFFYNGKDRTGSSSSYLWKKKIDQLSTTLTPSGGDFTQGQYVLHLPNGMTDKPLTLVLQPAPIVSQSKDLTSVGTTIDVLAKDADDNPVTQFSIPFELSVDYSAFDLAPYDLTTLSFYSSRDGGLTWQKETTTLDTTNKKATIHINHLTQFALMAKPKDTNPASTLVFLKGKKGEENLYRSDVELTLDATDNADGLGVDYILYKKQDGDWETYTAPITFSSEGHYSVKYYSVDKAGNVENEKTVIFDIDKTIPEAVITYDFPTMDFNFSSLDTSATVTSTKIKNNKEQVTVRDSAGNTTTLIIKDKQSGKNAKVNIVSIAYNDDSPIELNNNRFVVDNPLDALQKNKFAQKFIQKDIEKVKLVYDIPTDKTTVVIKVNELPKVKEIVDGLKGLQLQTEKGTLKYSY